MLHPFENDPTPRPVIVEDQVPHEVVPETVSQFTSRTDTVGQKIWEGNLIQNESGRVCKVIWHAPSASFDAVIVKSQPHDNAKGFAVVRWDTQVRVIGHIYD